MLELMLIPAAALLYAAYGDKLKKQMDDKEKIKVFFEVAGIAIKRNDKLQYPVFQEKKEDDRSITYIYKLPLGMPSKVIGKVEEVVAEGLGKPVRITYNNYKLYIRVFSREIPKKWHWSPNLAQSGKWKIPMGQSLEKLVYHDFDKTPHMLVGGLTRMGKTVFMKNLFATLIEANPDHAHFYIIDLKEKGLAFNRYRNMKQVKAFADTPAKALKVFRELKDRIEKQGAFMKENGYENITETKEKDRFFIIIDEGAVLAPAKGLKREVNSIREECQYWMSYIATTAGGLGFRLIFATQYPTVTAVPSVVKQMADAKIGFRLTTYKASEVVLDEGGLENLPSIPGRALYKTNQLTELQVPYITNEKMEKICMKYEVMKDELKRPEAEAPTGDSIDD
ncbi:FtsK/SpoIIIE domain-containing protein [Bacillus sp. OTU530]|uniref:FtsK/SpoIIIE domain-containing protein n=1 Tax=Bacillus sp. OTU530 TaxID=3043862 RepID=UPI00313B3B2B